MQTTETAMLDAALSYLKRGWSVFPLNGKRPLVDWKPFQTKCPSEEQMREWWTQWPDAGIGLALGKLSNVIRIDADGTAALAKLNEFGKMPETAEFVTPSGGRGWLLQHMEGITTDKLWKGDGDHEELRVQSDGAYTVLPPSPHPDCPGRYEWRVEDKLATVPRWLLGHYTGKMLVELVKEIRPTLRQPERREVEEALKHVDDADDYDRWIHVGMALHSGGDDYFQVWDEWSKKSAKYKEGETAKKWATFSRTPGGMTLRSILYWAEKGGWSPPNKHEPITDMGNARMLARFGEGKMKFTEKWGWMQWNGGRWTSEEAKHMVQELQKKVLETRLNLAIASLAKHLKAGPGEDKAKFAETARRKTKTINLIRKHEDESRIRGTRALAESEPSLLTNYRSFDKGATWLLNCPNGTLDVRTGEFREHNPEDMLTQVGSTKYDPQASAPRWEQFLEEILPCQGVRRFLQQFLGVCITGDTSPQMIPVFWGTGANGKSTLVEVVLYVLGEDYDMKAKRDLLIAKKQSEHPTSIARLRGKRFVACIESGEGRRLDETLVKELTGGDTIAARRMREDEWEFEPTFKTVLATNHKPEVIGTDNGIWRRIQLIEFNAKYAEDDPRRDPLLKEKLKAEASGILNWMLKGCQDWYENGRKFVLPDEVKRATSEYRQAQDRVGQFLDECCEFGEGKIRDSRLQEAYSAWCSLNQQKPQIDKLWEALKARGYVRGKGKHDFQGVRLRPKE